MGCVGGDESTHNHALELQEGLDGLRRDGILCDVVIRVQDKDFLAHTSVLAAVCQYFRSMFTSGMKESSERKVHLKGENLTADGFRSNLEYMYTGKFDNMTSENVFEILDMANHLQCEGAINNCSEFLVHQFLMKPDDVQNYVSSLQTAEMYGLTELRDAATDAMKENFVSISSKMEFFERISKDVLLCILAEDDLHVLSEVTVLEAVLSWINFDLENRLQHAQDLLSQVRLILIDPYQLNELCSLDSAMTVPHFQDVVKQTLIQHALPSQVQVCARGNFKKVLVAFGSSGSGYKTVGYVKYFNWTTKTWKEVCGLKLPSGKIQSTDTCIVHANCLYISCNKSIYSYVPAVNKWTDLKYSATSSSSSDSVSMAFLGKCLYVSLGVEIQRYNLTSGKWQYLYPLSLVMKQQGNPLKCITHIMAVDGCLFVLGDTEMTGSWCWIFNPELNEWRMSRSRSIADSLPPSQRDGKAFSFSESQDSDACYTVSVKVINQHICIANLDKKDDRLTLYVSKVGGTRPLTWGLKMSNADRWIPLCYQSSVVCLDNTVYIISKCHWIDTGLRISRDEKYGVDLKDHVPEGLRKLWSKQQFLLCEIHLRAEHLL